MLGERAQTLLWSLFSMSWATPLRPLYRQENEGSEAVFYLPNVPRQSVAGPGVTHTRWPPSKSLTWCEDAGVSRRGSWA